MESKDNNQSFQKIIETQVLEGLAAFFGNPDNFDHIVLAAMCRSEEFSKKLDDIAERLVGIDTELDSNQMKNTNILKKVSTSEISEEDGAAMLRFNEDSKRHLQEERVELQLKETQLCKQIRAMERFEDGGLWCKLYPKNLSFREKTDLLKVIVERVDVYVKMS